MKLTINSISLKISLTVALVILIFGCLTLWATYNFSVSQYSQEKKSEAVMMVNHGAKFLKEIFGQSQRTVLSISKDSLVVDLIKNKKNVDEAIVQLNNYNSDNIYSAIYVMGNDGIVLASTDSMFMKQDYSFREYFIRAKEGELFTDVNLGVTSKKLGYYFSAPIENEKQEIVGVAVLKMNPQIIEDSLKDILDKPMTDLMVTDKYGVVITSDKSERIYQSLGNLSPNELNQIVLEKKYEGVDIKGLQYESVMNFVRNKSVGIKTIDEYDKEDKDLETLVISPILNTNFYLIGEISMSDVITQSANLAKMIALMIGLAVLASIAFVVLLSARMLKPVGLLTKMAREISNGKFNQVNPIKGRDELAVLSTSMIRMAYELGEKYNDLEKLVDERTAKMESQNETLEKSKVAILNILDDINQAKTELEKFKLAVSEASDHVVITDEEGIILYANKALEKITGFTSEEVIGKKAGSKELWGGQMNDDFYKQLWKTIKIDKKVFSGEVNNKRKNGEKYIALASISPILGQDNEVLFFVAIERDITHEKEVDRMKTDFISLASHQLRTPLAAMKWFAEMLLAGDAGKLSDEQKEFVNSINESNNRMIVLVNSLLNISRIESGRIVVDPKSTDLRELVEMELKEIDKQIKDKKQEVVLSVDKNLPKINIDPKLITEVYKNLLTNANKYTQNGGQIKIDISLNGGEIISKISDNGLGIPKEAIDKVFGRFYRAPNVIKLETEGTGLGLYLAKAIVESSGGKIWLESIEGKGSTFWFSLPLSGIKKKIGEVTINS